MMSKPETAKLMESKGGTAWLAGDMWVLTYPISGGNLYNVACPRTHPNKDIPLGVNTPLEPEKLRQIYKDFCPDVRSILSLVEHCAIWPTADIPPLPTWVSQSGKVVLSGDAAVSPAWFLQHASEMLRSTNLTMDIACHDRAPCSGRRDVHRRRGSAGRMPVVVPDCF